MKKNRPTIQKALCLILALVMVLGMLPTSIVSAESAELYGNVTTYTGGTVTGDIIGLAGDFFHHLSTHIGIGALEFDFLGDADAVFGDLGGAEFLVENDVAAFGAQSGFDGLGEQGHAFEDAATGFIRKNKLFSHNNSNSLKFYCQPMTARMSSCATTLYSLPPTLTSVPP